MQLWNNDEANQKLSLEEKILLRKLISANKYNAPN